jgi:hypothetical protein
LHADLGEGGGGAHVQGGAWRGRPNDRPGLNLRVRARQRAARRARRRLIPPTSSTASSRYEMIREMGTLPQPRPELNSAKGRALSQTHLRVCREGGCGHLVWFGVPHTCGVRLGALAVVNV